MKELTDDEIRERLKELDESDASCTAWEGDFLEGVLYENPGRKLTDKQRAVAMQMLERYSEYLS